MSDTPTTTTGSESTEAAPNAAPEGGDSGDQDSGAERPMPREQRYRLQLREAEAARDALAQRVEQYQRAEIERLAAEHLSMPGDLFSLSGNELADYLTEDGDVDADKVAADAAALLAERPGLKKGTRAFDPSQGFGGKPPGKGTPTFADLLR